MLEKEVVYEAWIFKEHPIAGRDTQRANAKQH